MSENTTSKATSEPKVRQPVLRKVDLNLLTIFDTVMQEQSLTKAAHTLGMSQPAVSSAVSRLKVLFKDELFVRNGRGIKPTERAFQLFSSVRRALSLVQMSYRIRFSTRWTANVITTFASVARWITT
jgi:LysR family transcriptional activator for leuABCD operon